MAFPRLYVVCAIGTVTFTVAMITLFCVPRTMLTPSVSVRRMKHVIVTTADKLASEESPAAEFNKKTEGGCKAALSRSTCAKEDYRGLIVAYHGFTACTDQYDEFTPRWTDSCWDVWAPVLPGHALGGNVLQCGGKAGGPYDECTVSWDGGGRGFDLTELPTGYGYEYSNFVTKTTAVAERELEFSKNMYKADPSAFKSEPGLGVVGLSLGAAIAFRAVMDKPEVWSRALIIHPMLGLGQEGSDFVLRGCLMDYHGTPGQDSCGKPLREYYLKSLGLSGFLRTIVKSKLSGTTGNAVQKHWLKFMTSISKHAPAMFASDILDSPVVWQGACNKITDWGRQGFCGFMRKHMLGVHVFGEYSRNIAAKGKFPVTQWFLTETDGITRNGLAYSAAKKIRCGSPDTKSAVCIHLFQEGQQYHSPDQGPGYWDKNFCMPHASIGSHENNDLGPISARWWEPRLTDSAANFFKDQDNVGDRQAYVRDRNLCLDMSLKDGAEKEEWMRYTLFPRSDENWETCEEHDSHWR